MRTKPTPRPRGSFKLKTKHGNNRKIYQLYQVRYTVGRQLGVGSEYPETARFRRIFEKGDGTRRPKRRGDGRHGLSLWHAESQLQKENSNHRIYLTLRH